MARGFSSDRILRPLRLMAELWSVNIDVVSSPLFRSRSRTMCKTRRRTGKVQTSNTQGGHSVAACAGQGQGSLDWGNRSCGEEATRHSQSPGQDAMAHLQYLLAGTSTVASNLLAHKRLTLGLAGTEGLLWWR
jgi:hypothetical protein